MNFRLFLTIFFIIALQNNIVSLRTKTSKYFKYSCVPGECLKVSWDGKGTCFKITSYRTADSSGECVDACTSGECRAPNKRCVNISFGYYAYTYNGKDSCRSSCQENECYDNYFICKTASQTRLIGTFGA